MLSSILLHDGSHRRSVARSTSLQRVPLTQSHDDRRVYSVESVGTLRGGGWTWDTATAEAAGRAWELTRRGSWRFVIQAADAAGSIAGEYKRRRLHRPGTLRWSNRELTLRPDGPRRESYTLVEDDHKLATFGGAGTHQLPLNITINNIADMDPGLVLFAIYVVRTLAPKRSQRPRA